MTLMMKLTSYLARDEIRKYQEVIHNLQAEIIRLRENGLAQAKDFATEIKAIHKKYKELEEESATVQRQLQEANTNLATAQGNEQSLQNALEARTEEFKQQVEALEQKLKESGEEGELLLLQLHQVQEELETVFLSEQGISAQLRDKDSELEAQKKQLALNAAAEKNLLNEKAALTAERDKLRADAQAEKAKAEQAIALLTKEKQELAVARDAKAQELSQTIQQREQLTQIIQGETQKVVALQAEKEQLQHRHEALSAEKQQIIAERDQLAAELSKLAQTGDEQARQAIIKQQEFDQHQTQVLGQVQEAQQENELLLLQLHQVQEELEHFFLEHQKLTRETDNQAKRWQRLETRHPNYLDCESVLPVAVDAFADEPTVEWRLGEVTVGGAILPELVFTTFLRDGKPGIALKTIDTISGKPISLAPKVLIQDQSAEEIARFRNISTGDWRLMLTAASAIELYFNQAPQVAAGLPDDFDIAFWKQAILPVVSEIRALPPVIRFDRVQLKRELIHTDYEHLWLILHDVSYGSHQRWPKLELRLGAANIMPGAFSRQPKIELPRIDGKTIPFPSWFEESYDDFGGKLELRFELSRKLFDVGVWTRLQANDQRFMLSLIGGLPLILARLQADKVAIARPWAEWQGLANGMVDVLRLRMSEAQERNTAEVASPAPAAADPVPATTAEPFEAAGQPAQAANAPDTKASGGEPSQAIVSSAERAAQVHGKAQYLGRKKRPKGR